MLDHVPMGERDTKGDLYENMLGKIATVTLDVRRGPLLSSRARTNA